MNEWREFTAAGGLMSYGASLAAGYRQPGSTAAPGRPASLAAYQDRIVINLEPTNALGLASRHRSPGAPMS